MNKLIDDDGYRENFLGYTIYDCSLRNGDRYCFLLVEQKGDRDVLPRTRVIIVAADLPKESRFGFSEAGHYSFMTIARGEDPPEYVAVDMRGNVYSTSASRKGEEKSMHSVTETKAPSSGRVVFVRVVCAAGKVYALGTYRKIYRREGMDHWVNLESEGKGLPLPPNAAKDHMLSQRVGFMDLAAFSEDDMYAVGGEGDVWHFNGTAWKQIAFPSNELLETVCCAGDGQVYISDAKGSVWRGRDSQWQKLVEGELSPGHAPVDAVWFKGRLYLGAREGVWTLDEQQKSLVTLESVQRDAPNFANSGRLDVTPDGDHLLTAGPYGAYLYDGQRWKRLFSAFDFT